jgi:hypothetical protein
VIRREVARKQKEFDSHRAEIAKLCDTVEKLDGVPYAAKLFRAPGRMFAAPAGNPWAGMIPVESVSMRLAREIKNLRRQAAVIESQAADTTKGGRITGRSLEELLAAIVDNPLAPTKPQVSDWLAKATAAADAEWQRRLDGEPAGYIPPRREILYVLHWDGDGNILGPSSASNQEVRDIAAEDAAARAAMARITAGFNPTAQPTA